MKEDPRLLSLVTFTKKVGNLVVDPSAFSCEWEMRAGVGNYIPVFVYLGEIPNMLGHAVVVGKVTGKVYVGYHTGDFRELTDEEV